MKYTNVTFIGWFRNGNMFTKDLSIPKWGIGDVTRDIANFNQALVHAIVDNAIVHTEDARGQ